MKNIKEKAMPAGRQGFTLVELLIIIAVIGLLAGMVVISMKNVKAKARDTQRVSDVGTIAKALNMYQNGINVYPIFDGYITGTDVLSTTLKNAGAINAMPIDPTNTDNYRYYYQGVDGEDFYLEYYLETTSFIGDTGRKCDAGGKCYIAP